MIRMKLKTRIIIGFGMSILVPLLLFSASLYGLSHTKLAQQAKNSSEVVYDISVGESANSQTQVRLIAKDLLFTATVILVFTALSIGLWIGETEESHTEYQRRKSGFCAGCGGR